MFFKMFGPTIKIVGGICVIGLGLAASYYGQAPTVSLSTTSSTQSQPAIVVRNHPAQGFLAFCSLCFQASGIGLAAWGYNDRLELLSQAPGKEPKTAWIQSPELGGQQRGLLQVRPAQSPSLFPELVEGKSPWFEEGPVSIPDPSSPMLPPPFEELAELGRDGDHDRKLHLLGEILDLPGNQWIKKLMKTPLLVKGGQGSGKTEFVAFLMLLRKLLLNHRIEVCDPHGHLNHSRWLCSTLYGSNYNYAEITERIQAYYQRLKNKGVNPDPYTTVWDEFTNYAARVPEVNDFLLSVLSDTRKAKEYPILISHNEAKGGLGGGNRSGFQEMKEAALIVVSLIAHSDRWGEPVPGLRGVVRNLEKDDLGQPLELPIQLDSWMRPAWLISVFPELNQPPQLVSNSYHQAEFDLKFNRNDRNGTRAQN